MRILRGALRVLAWALLGVVLLGLAGALFQEIVSRREAAAFPPPGRLVDIGERRLHMQCTGRGLPTVLLEAGGTQSGVRQFAKIQKSLEGVAQLCAYDRAGMGWSDPGPMPRSARALANDLEQLVAHADLPPPYVIVAGSAGGLTAELFARDQPDRVAGVVLLDAIQSGFIEAMPGGAVHLERRACFARVLAHTGLLRIFDPFHLGDTPVEERGVAIALGYRSSTWDAICSLVAASGRSLTELRAAPPLRKEIPLIVIRHDPDYAGTFAADHGAPEPNWQAEQAKVAASSLHGELIVATGSGHGISEDRADLVVAAVRRLVSAWSARVGARDE